jgi:membrane protease YdiL (CAAX protease family)
LKIKEIQLLFVLTEWTPAGTVLSMNMDVVLPAEPPAAPRKTWLDRVQALFEVLLLAGFASSILAALPFAFSAAGRSSLLASVRLMSMYLLLEAFITFVLLFLVMRAHGETLKGLGLSLMRWRFNALLGIAIIPVLFVLNFIVSVIFQAFFPRYVLEHNPLTELIHTPLDLVIFVTIALVAGGVKEELQRAFILRRFQAHLGGADLGLVLWSIAFGLGHYVQGTQGMVAAGTFGLILGIAYLARGNLIVPMVAHGAYDTIALLGYWYFTSHR